LTFCKCKCPKTWSKKIRPQKLGYFSGLLAGFSNWLTSPHANQYIGEMEKWRNGKLANWENGVTGETGNGKMGDGEMGRHQLIQSRQE
jgi:hypothetical protein